MITSYRFETKFEACSSAFVIFSLRGMLYFEALKDPQPEDEGSRKSELRVR